MPIYRERSIRQKLTMMVILASGAALLLACAALLSYELFTYREGMVRMLSVRANIIGANSASALLFNDEAAAVDTLAALNADPHVVSAGIYTRDNQAFATYGRSDKQRAIALRERFADHPDGHWFESDGLILFRKIVFKGETIGTVYIQCDLEEMNARFWQYLAIIFVVLLASSSVALLISSRLQGKITRPLFHLVETAQIVSHKKDYSIRAVIESHDEMGTLVRAFNEMLVQIQERDAALRKSSDELEQRVINRTQELHAANKELEAFSYSVSHDLRAPLRSIDGFSQALLEDYAATLDQQGREFLQRIRVNSQRMAQLIDDLLNLSRMTRCDIQRGPVDMSAIAFAIASELQRTSPDRQAEWFIAPSVIANGDARLLRVVLENLLGNAWKFTSKQERAAIEVGVMPHERTTAFYVRDNGAGFDMAYAGKLFGAFQRVHEATEFEGTGIGLATVQRIIHRHGGRVWAESAVDRGATFYFTL